MHASSQLTVINGKVILLATLRSCMCTVPHYVLDHEAKLDAASSCDLVQELAFDDDLFPKSPQQKPANEYQHEERKENRDENVGNFPETCLNKTQDDVRTYVTSWMLRNTNVTHVHIFVCFYLNV